MLQTLANLAQVIGVFAVLAAIGFGVAPARTVDRCLCRGHAPFVRTSSCVRYAAVHTRVKG